MSRKLLLFLLCFFSLPLVLFSQTKGALPAYKMPEKDCATLKLKISNLLSKMNEVPDTSGYIIVYEGNDEIVVSNSKGKKTTKQILPRAGEINLHIQGIQEMIKNMEVPDGKIKVINGGFRNKFAIDFWTVPKGAEPPKPTPNLKKMKYRKGSISPQFPYWDC